MISGRSVLAALIVAGCSSTWTPEDERCPNAFSPTYFEDVPRDFVVVDASGTSMVVALRYKAIAWFELGFDRSLKPRISLPDVFPVPVAMYMYSAVLVQPWPAPGGRGMRVLSSTDAYYVDPSAEEARRVSIVARNALLPYGFSIQRTWRIEKDSEEIYVQWDAPSDPADRSQVGEQIAGLGRLDRGDGVRALGRPIFRGRQTASHIAVRGAWDSVAGHWWWDEPDGRHVLRVSRDGDVLERIPIVGEVWITDWVQLPSGRFAGLSAGQLHLFDPADRSGEPQALSEGSGRARLLHKGDELWTLQQEEDELVVRAWEETGGQLIERGSAVRSPFLTGHCDLLLGTY